ncbi:MAG: transposase, partial [Acidimicrobiia bacterium]
MSLPRVRALAAMLGQDPQHIPEFLPPLWHWGFAYEPVTPGLVGDDGHPLRGGFLPPVSLRRRMRAGGRVEILGELAIGAGIRRVSTVTTVDEKVGRTGPLAFVTVEHRIQVEGHEVI